MSTRSQLQFEKMSGSQQAAHAYYEGVARGDFREKTVTDTFGALADVKCANVCFNNTSGKVMGVRRGGSGVVIKIPNNCGQIFDVTSNADELQIHNAEDTASITVQYQCGGEHVS